MAMAVMRVLVQRLREADRKIGSLALLDVYGRVARLLLDMSEDVDGQKMVTKRLPKQDIAKMIGASREMVSRVMKDLQMGGYIEMRGVDHRAARHHPAARLTGPPLRAAGVESAHPNRAAMAAAQKTSAAPLARESLPTCCAKPDGWCWRRSPATCC